MITTFGESPPLVLREVPKKKRERIRKNECLFIQTDEYAADKFMVQMRRYAGQGDGPVHISLDDLDDLEYFCYRSPYRLGKLLRDIRHKAEMEGVEDIIFF